MGTTTTMRGLCPACFREMDVDDGVLHKHGWTEGGGRKVGEYGLAWHTGSCFGVGWAPFEVSPDGTWAYLKERLFPYALDVETTLGHLRGRPTLTVPYDFDTGESLGWGHGTRKESRRVTLKPGETKKVETSCRNGYSRTRTFDYEKELEKMITAYARELRAAKADGEATYTAADTWKPAKLKEKKANGATVHYKRDGARAVFCSSRSHYLTTSSDAAEVLASPYACSRCRKALEAEAARKAVREAEKADGETLTGWVTKHGPAKAKTIKKALGWDTKRFNKAEDRADGVSSDWSRPKLYMTKAAYRAAMDEKYGS